MRARPVLVILGARVRADGTPSGTLQRRIDAALAAGRRLAGPLYVPTGGKGDSGHVEADCIARGLSAAGIGDADILCEREAADTLQSAILVDRLLRSAGIEPAPLIPCTSPYHVRRSAALFRALGHRVEQRPMPGDRGHLPLLTLLWYHGREWPALIWDLALMRVRGGG